MKSYYHFMLYACIFLKQVKTETFSLRVLTGLDGCRGGEICDQQPAVAIINARTQQIAFGFEEGSVYAQIEDRPSGYEELYIGQSCNYTDCGEKVVGSLASVPIIRGVATFENLMIREAGEDYTIRFIGRDPSFFPFAEVSSDPFPVTTGDLYRLDFYNFTGTAFGGEPFSPNPIIAAVDRGGNIITDLNAGTLEASLSLTPHSEEQLLPDTNRMASFVNGLAVFEGLYLNTVGYPYQLTFQSDLTDPLTGEVLPGLPSRPFDVVVGSPSRFEFSHGTNPSNSSKFSGEFFQVPPKVRLLDAGGNLVYYDNSSALRVSIRDNPVGASIGPEENNFVVAEQGVVSFNALRISRPGSNLTLRFTLFNYSSLTNKYTETPFSLVSEKFTVLLGPPRHLVMTELADEAWAGGQAFEYQPAVAMTDYAGNFVVTDTETTAEASIVESLSVASEVVIDTSNSPTIGVRAVGVNVSSGEYGAGHVFDIIVRFEANVWLRDSGGSGAIIENLADNTMYLLLNISTCVNPTTYPTIAPSSEPSTTPTVEPTISPTSPTVEPSVSPTTTTRRLLEDGVSNYARAYLVGRSAQTKSFIFRYEVVPGDAAPVFDYFDSDSLMLEGDAGLVDGNGKPVNLTLPAQGLRENKAISIDTTSPQVVDIFTTTSDGEYGAGDVVSVSVWFDKPVVVQGFPFFLMNTYNESGRDRGVALFTNLTEDCTTLKFKYKILEGQMSEVGTGLGIFSSSIIFGNNTLNRTTAEYLNFTSTNSSNNATITNAAYSYGVDFMTSIAGFIQRKSDHPITLANYTLPSELRSALVLGNNITVDTSAPSLDTSYGVRTSHPDGTFYPGQHINLYVRFNKPIVTFGDGIFLHLDCGPVSPVAADFRGFAWVTQLLPDNHTLEFLYVVEPGVNTSRLDLAAGNDSLIIQQSNAFIKRLTAESVTDAVLNTTDVFSSGNSLRDTAAIALYGFSPTVLSTALVETVPVNASVLYPDDSALIEVRFSVPVLSVCPPVLVIAATFFREAKYVSGNMTDRFLFRYTVKVGDRSDQALSYRHTPYALCPVSGCPKTTHCRIYANATVPTSVANLYLARSGPDTPTGVTISSDHSVHPVSLTRNTSVTLVSSLSAPGEYGAGSVLRFQVQFSDKVKIANPRISSGLPRLYLNIGEFALYSGGNGEDSLEFLYITTESDVWRNESVNPALIDGTDSALQCSVSDLCLINNEAGAPVSLATTLSTVLEDSGMTLDPTPPFITNIWSDKRASPFSDQLYTVGEEFPIYVKFSKSVLVTGFDPRLPMDVVREGQFALYRPELSSNDTLVFMYTVQQGDVSSELTYLGDTLDLYGGLSIIYRASDIPVTEANVSLPSSALPLSDAGEQLAVNTLVEVTVVNVSSVSPAGRYAAGDVLVIRVEFSREVIVEGRSYLTLNVGGRAAKANYIGYRPVSLGSVVMSNENGTYLDTWVEPTPKNPSNVTKTLFYAYVVELNDYTVDLRYVDSCSLFPGLTDLNDPGYIKHASSRVKQDANLTLPTPGTEGSMAHDGLIVMIDGFSSYLTSLDFTVPDGVYGTSTVIGIIMNFSSPVVVIPPDEAVSEWNDSCTGPSIILETGYVDAEACYVSGSGSSSLLFEFTPEPGHYSSDLEYAWSRINFNSANNSFRYNNAQVLTMSGRPTLPAIIWFNPPTGELLGHTSETVALGEFRYKDLQITKKGPDYMLRFSATTVEALGQVLTTTQQPLVNSFSSEWQARHKGGAALEGQLAGFATDIDRDILAVGCPNCNLSVTTIQTVTTSANFLPVQREIQRLKTEVTPRAAVQSFYTTGDVGTTVSGGFTISYELLGPTQLIPANADPITMQAILRFGIPSLKNVTITREPYILCACRNAFIWTLTFNEYTQGEFSPLSVDDSALTSPGAEVVGPQVLVSPARLDGTFIIYLDQSVSSPVPFDASVSDIRSAFEGLGLPVFDVQISPADLTLSRIWDITFGSFEDSYEMPLVGIDASGLFGGDTTVAFIQETRPGRHGPDGISGTFALSWRGNVTRDLPAHATAAEMKEALEELPVINFVNVNRTQEPLFLGYTWTVEFVSVNENSPRGLVLQDTSNLEPMVPVNNLIATEPEIKVGAIWGLGSRNEVAGLTRQGTFGEGAGAVHLYQRRNESWVEVATLRGNDTTDNNRFGSSVALFRDSIIVGAVGANMNGRPEKQSIRCSAVQGSFQISFRGWTTDPISYNVTRKQLEAAIETDPRIFQNLYPIQAIDIDDWGGGGLCANNTAVITFYGPIHGAATQLGVDTREDLELLTLENIDLLDADGNTSAVVLEIEEVEKATWRLYGPGSDPQQIGAAYVFRATDSCITDPVSNFSSCARETWVQEAQLFPTRSRVGSRFGHAVALTGNLALVGAPGSDNEEGLVYVFEYSTNGAGAGSWTYVQRLTSPLLEGGEHFGHSVAINGNTLMVGCPDFDNAKGTVFMFTRDADGEPFIGLQQLEPSERIYPLADGSQFGFSVSLRGNLLVVGAPGYDDYTVYLGREESKFRAVDAGAVFVFQRANALPNTNYRFLEKLKPSNVREQDRFGHAVAVDSGRIIASGVQESFLAPQPGRPVVEFRTHATYNELSLSGSFRLLWLDSTTEEYAYSTRLIPYDASAALLRNIMIADLPPLALGRILVSRSRVDAFDGGYSWEVTFMDYPGGPRYASAGPTINLFSVDVSELKGTNAAVSVSFVHENPPELRGLTHVFQRVASSTSPSTFTEQFLISPHRHQSADRCGFSVALSGTYAVVGCPHRDLFVPEQHSGAAFVYHLGLLAIQPAFYRRSVYEGLEADLSVEHESGNIALIAEDLSFYFRTLDRNAFSQEQRFVSNLYGVKGSEVSYPGTVLDFVGLSGSAIARSQFYGSDLNQSQWVDGMYDYRGVADYVPVNREHVLLVESESVSDSIITNADSILETPDEDIVVALTSPGVWPSVFGRLYASVQICDLDDGNVLGDAKYRKLYDTTLDSVADEIEQLKGGAELGASIAVSESLGLMVVGAPQASVGGRDGAGKALLFRKDQEGNWTQEAPNLDSPFFSSPQPELEGIGFGRSVAVTQVYSRNISLVAIGEPHVNRVYVYSSDADLSTGFQLEATLSEPEAEYPQHGYGERGAIALHGPLLVVGAPGLESVWIYRRFFSDSVGWYWTEGELLLSSEYDYDVILGVSYPHRQGFGSALAVSGRSLVVGAPFAGYDKLASDLAEVSWETEGTDIFSTARGKVFVFYSTPAVQYVALNATQQLVSGEFQLSYFHQGSNGTTVKIPFDVSAAEMTEALLELPNIDSVEVEASFGTVEDESGTFGHLYSWTITFLSDWQEPGLLQPLWSDNGCGNCSAFSSDIGGLGFSRNSSDHLMFVTRVRGVGNLTERQTLQALTPRRGDRFGAAVAIDGEQLVVGAPHSSANTITSWDFEAGSLVGWRKTGNAFDFQPTFGDSSSLHKVQTPPRSLKTRGRARPTNVKGRYYIGTYELRPGNPHDFTTVSPEYPEGTIQGDAPTGTLTSDVFIIRGTDITFLIGGGCDPLTEYVELLVDGLSVARETGRCAEKMRKVSFDVGLLQGRAAQIRVVDDSSENWGHINVDHFQFDWDVHGASVRGDNLVSTAGGLTETPFAGAAYVYRRSPMDDRTRVCPGDKGECAWQWEEKLLSSDKRAMQRFGASVAVNDAAGIIAVGAPGAAFTGFFKQLPSVYPYQNESNGDSVAANIQFPAAPKNMQLFQSYPLDLALRSGAYGVWTLMEQLGLISSGGNAHGLAGNVGSVSNRALEVKAFEEGGAVYTFSKRHAVVSASGQIIQQQMWFPLEHAKLQPPDASAGDRFGEALALNGHTLAVGATGQNGLIADTGASYMYRVEFAAVNFSAVEYPVIEGVDRIATVTLLRDPLVFSGTLVLEYATSDLTAKGVDPKFFAQCSAMPVGKRAAAGCGDYEQTVGTVVIEEGQVSGGFTVAILNDQCYERYMEYIQITVSVPGAAALQSEKLSVRIRIDDDDFDAPSQCF